MVNWLDLVKFKLNLVRVFYRKSQFFFLLKFIFWRFDFSFRSILLYQVTLSNTKSAIVFPTIEKGEELLFETDI